MDQDPNLQQRLKHVLWIGGSVCAGKTSIARLLGAKYCMPVYHFDQHERDHIARGHPSPSVLMTPDELWLRPTPEQLAERTIASWTSRFPFVVEDLLSLPADGPIVAEGAGFFPEVISPILSNPHQAIWLVASRSFLPAMRFARGMGLPGLTSDPKRVMENIIARDLLMAEHIRRSAAESGLPVVEVDGTRTLEEVAQIVEDHFTCVLQR
jgi:hypothetical protein